MWAINSINQLYNPGQTMRTEFVNESTVVIPTGTMTLKFSVPARPSFAVSARPTFKVGN